MRCFNSTIALGVTSVVVRGRETLQVGRENIPCVIVDVTYGEDGRRRKYSFWISEDRAIVLKRSVWKGEARKTFTSSVVALTFNEEIPSSTFQFSPPAEAKRVAY